MATTRLAQSPIAAPHVSSPTHTPIQMIKPQVAAFLATHTLHNCTRFTVPQSPFGFWAKKQSSSIISFSRSDDKVITEEVYYKSIPQIKDELYAATQGINRGIFGVPSEKKNEIERLVGLLEAQNPNSEPTLCLEKAAGSWRVVYSTITILGSKRTKLGLRDFITLGDFIQYIDVVEGKAVNIIKFSAKGLNLLNGQLIIDASFKIVSKSRVDITCNYSTITPEQLMNVFRKNYHLLLDVFNPEGWLEITYVDDTMRIGRDDKGNIFILDRIQQDNAANITDSSYPNNVI